VAVLTSMVFWMRKVSRSIKASLHASVDAALAHSSGQTLALIAMIFFAVAREGVESVFFLLAIFQQSSGSAAPLGALLGVILATLLGYGIYAGGVKLDLRRFFRWTGVFVLIVAAGILAGALRSLHEAGIWNHLQTVVFDLSGALPMDSPLGTIFAGFFGYQDAPSLGAVIAYVLFLAVTLVMLLSPPMARPAVIPTNQPNR
jgi:high-affinity iron transporter